MRATARGALLATIEREGEEIDVTAEFTVTAGCPATYSSWTGWSPPEGPEMEIGAVHLDNDLGEEIELTEEELTRIEALAWDAAAQLPTREDYEADQADSRHASGEC